MATIERAAAEHATTVIVARRVLPGHERDGERWIGRIRNAAAHAPGFLAADVHPPGDDHPDEWLVVYSFATAADLDTWLHSPARTRLLDAGRDLFRDDIREQRVSTPKATESVTLVSSITLKPGAAAQHRDLHDHCVAAARHLGGLVRHELLPAIPGAQPQTVALLTFASRADLNRWLDSDERRAALAAMDDLVAGPRTLNVLGGFAGWFAPTTNPPRRWKQALAVLAGLIPVSLLTTTLRANAIPHAPLIETVVVGAVLNTVLLTWLVMPQITRRLGPWLAR